MELRAFVRIERGWTDAQMDEALAKLTEEDRKSIRHVMVYVNQLTRVPPLVLDLTAITQLSLNGNPLRRLPEELGQLKRLKKLFVERCELTELPLCINGLTRLTALFFNGNELATVPPLTKLIHLDAIWTIENKLPSCLSKEYGDLEDAVDGERGGKTKVQPFLQRLEAHFLAGPQEAVLFFLQINRYASGSPIAKLPRALAVWMMQRFVWTTRFDAVWADACAALAQPMKKERKKGSANKKRHPKKERKPGSGMKGFVLGI